MRRWPKTNIRHSASPRAITTRLASPPPPAGRNRPLKAKPRKTSRRQATRRPAPVEHLLCNSAGGQARQRSAAFKSGREGIGEDPATEERPFERFPRLRSLITRPGGSHRDGAPGFMRYSGQACFAARNALGKRADVDARFAQQTIRHERAGHASHAAGFAAP